jgi:paspaline synthase
MVQRNLHWIFAVSIAGWMSAHLALVAHVGQDSAPAWSSWFCQLLLSAGGLCQLIVRGSTRGTSFFIWYFSPLAQLMPIEADMFYHGHRMSRFLGTVLALPYEILRYRHGYENVVWHSPLGWWGGVAFFLLDGSYGACLWYLRQSERKASELPNRKAK